MTQCDPLVEHEVLTGDHLVSHHDSGCVDDGESPSEDRRRVDLRSSGADSNGTATKVRVAGAGDASTTLTHGRR